MYGRWFYGSYLTAVLFGFLSAPFIYLQSPVPLVIGFYYIPFAFPFALVGSLVGWGAQWAVEQLLARGWPRTALLIAITAPVGYLGLTAFAQTATPLAVAAAFSAAAGAVLTQHEAAWRRAWAVILAAALAATAPTVVLFR